MKDAEAVGYFTAATKLMVIAVGLSSALGTVMMPRTSNLVAENKMNEFKELVQNHMILLLLLRYL